VARRARRLLGSDLPVAFFSSAGRKNLRAEWLALLSAIDSLDGQHAAQDRSSVIAASRATFGALETLLRRPVYVR
jgi:hypothetical protein